MLYKKNYTPYLGGTYSKNGKIIQYLKINQYNLLYLQVKEEKSHDDHIN